MYETLNQTYPDMYSPAIGRVVGDYYNTFTGPGWLQRHLKCWCTDDCDPSIHPFCGKVEYEQLCQHCSMRFSAQIPNSYSDFGGLAWTL
jgi:hypothetical protein